MSSFQSFSNPPLNSGNKLTPPPSCPSLPLKVLSSCDISQLLLPHNLHTLLFLSKQILSYTITPTWYYSQTIQNKQKTINLLQLLLCYNIHCGKQKQKITLNLQKKIKQVAEEYERKQRKIAELKEEREELKEKKKEKKKEIEQLVQCHICNHYVQNIQSHIYQHQRQQQRQKIDNFQRKYKRNSGEKDQITNMMLENQKMTFQMMKLLQAPQSKNSSKQMQKQIEEQKLKSIQRQRQRQNLKFKHEMIDRQQRVIKQFRQEMERIRKQDEEKQLQHRREMNKIQQERRRRKSVDSRREQHIFQKQNEIFTKIITHNKQREIRIAERNQEKQVKFKFLDNEMDQLTRRILSLKISKPSQNQRHKQQNPEASNDKKIEGSISPNSFMRDLRYSPSIIYENERVIPNQEGGFHQAEESRTLILNQSRSPSQIQGQSHSQSYDQEVLRRSLTQSQLEAQNNQVPDFVRR